VVVVAVVAVGWTRMVVVVKMLTDLDIKVCHLMPMIPLIPRMMMHPQRTKEIQLFQKQLVALVSLVVHHAGHHLPLLIPRQVASHHQQYPHHQDPFLYGYLHHLLLNDHPWLQFSNLMHSCVDNECPGVALWEARCRFRCVECSKPFRCGDICLVKIERKEDEAIAELQNSKSVSVRRADSIVRRGVDWWLVSSSDRLAF
jgi:hypothetical protein